MRAKSDTHMKGTQAVSLAPAPVEFTIPAVPLSRNRLDQHWALRAREDERWRGLVDLYGSQDGRIAGPVIVELTFYAPRPSDPDNLARTVCNALKDRYRKVGKRMVLVSRGIIDDDDWRTVTELRLRSRKGERRTVVRVEQAT